MNQKPEIVFLPCDVSIYIGMRHAGKTSKTNDQMFVKIDSSRNSGKGRKVSPAKAWRLLKQVLDSEQFRTFVSSLPPQLTTEAFLSGNSDEFLGRYLLGDRLEEYMTAPFYKRRRILAQVLAQHIEAAGLPVPEQIQNLANKRAGTRGPRSGSKLAKYQELLYQTHHLLQAQECNHIQDYLQAIEVVLQHHIQKMLALRDYLKNRREKQQ